VSIYAVTVIPNNLIRLFGITVTAYIDTLKFAKFDYQIS